VNTVTVMPTYGQRQGQGYRDPHAVLGSHSVSVIFTSESLSQSPSLWLNNVLARVYIRDTGKLWLIAVLLYAIRSVILAQCESRSELRE
jgi:hypothetical protein